MTIDTDDMVKRGVVITDGNERSALAAVRSLGRRGVPVYVGADTTTSLAGKSRYCAGTFRYPSPWEDTSGYVASLKQAVGSWDAAAIFPMTDVAMELVGARRAEFEQLTAIPAPPLEQYHQLSNKFALNRWAESNSVPVPPTCYVEDGNVEAALDWIDSWPVIVKPGRSIIASGNGLRRTSVLIARDADELRKLYHDHWFLHEPSMVQKYVQGIGEGVFGLFVDGAPEALSAHRRLRERPPSGGVSVYREAIALPEAMTAHACRIVASAHWTGVAMVEFKVDPVSNTPYLMEVNGRFWGSLQLAIDSGVDFPWLLYQLACGHPRDPDPAPYAVGVRSRWWLGDLDHLITRFRRSEVEKALPPGSSSRFQTLLSLVNVLDGKTRAEVFRLSDPAPGVLELTRFVASSAAGLGRKMSKMARSALAGASRAASDWRLRRGAHKAELDASFPERVASILVLCKGNICRSPFADRFLHEEARRRGLALRVFSAGLEGIDGRDAYPLAQTVAARMGVDLAAHRARAVSAAMIAEADLVLVMEPEQRSQVQRRFPLAVGKTFLMGHLVADRPVSTIADPYGKDTDAFNECFTTLIAASEALIARISQAATAAEPQP